MPLNANEEALLGQPDDHDLDNNHQRIEYSPKTNLIGKWSVVALILNRTIGSGVFLSPHRVLAGTGCVGGALLLWLLAGLLSICGAYVWLECGLSMPQRSVRGEDDPRGVPRSGGEKNFLEYMFPNNRLRQAHLRTTCAYSIMFLVMYNLSANAIQFGIQVMLSTGLYSVTDAGPPNKGIVTAIAIGTLTFVVLMHTFSRRGGILINNAFAIVKVGTLFVIIFLGIASAAGKFQDTSEIARRNFTQNPFTTSRTDVGSWTSSLVLCLFSYSGYKQPFQVLAECRSPRRVFPKYVILSVIFAAFLFVAVNISFLLVVPAESILARENSASIGADMSSLFFQALFKDQDQAVKALSALVAISIFGNLIVLTFTAARVKQEIAKEGILPLSLFFATSRSTPWALIKRWMWRTNEDMEQAPAGAFLLHWFSSIFLVLIMLPIEDVRLAYSALVNLYTYTIVLILGFWVSGGLLMIKFRKETWRWQDRRRYRPALSPAHAIIYFLATTFLLATLFVPPATSSPFDQRITKIPFWTLPAIALSLPFWGVVYYWGILLYQKSIGRELEVTRMSYIQKDPDCPSEYVQVAEIIDHSWLITSRDGSSSDDFESHEGDAHKGRKGFGMKVNPLRSDRYTQRPMLGVRRMSDQFEE